MKRRMTGRTWQVVGMAIAAAVGISASVYGVPAGGVVQSWSEAVFSGIVDFTNPAGNPAVISVGFRDASMPDDVGFGDVLVDSSFPDSIFEGDYNSVSELSFVIAGDGKQPAQLRVFLRPAGSIRELQYVVDTSLIPATGESVTITVPMTESAWRGIVDWTSDLQNIGTVGIRVVQGGWDAQSYTISEFKIDGAAGATFLPGRVLNHFGVDGVDALPADWKTADVNGNGIADYLEVWAGLDPTDPNSALSVKIVEATADGVTIEWPCVAEGEYSVFWTANLDEPFSVIESALTASEDEVSEGKKMYLDETAGDAVGFYRVVFTATQD